MCRDKPEKGVEDMAAEKPPERVTILVSYETYGDLMAIAVKAEELQSGRAVKLGDVVQYLLEDVHGSSTLLDEIAEQMAGKV